MHCWNCKHEIPDTAKACAHCDAPIIDEPTANEMEEARMLLEQLPPDAAAELRRAIFESGTAEELLDRVFVGNCPKCDSHNTSDCEDDPKIGDLLVGRCYDCGQLWCTECDRLLKVSAPSCDCLTDDDD